MSRMLSILGSTGSIGTQTLQLVDLDPSLSVAALAACSNVELLLEQIRKYQPKLVCVYREEKAEELKKLLPGISGSISSAGGTYDPARDCKVVSGMEGLIEAACFPDADTVVVSVVGMIGIQPTIAAIRAKKKIALANKETLVCAGHLIMPLVKECGAELLPVDSEHSAIFQCLVGEPEAAVEKLLLTASGGPFRGYTKEQLQNIRPEDALKHPNWSMGAKITIDSSTMINKALEVMEAHHLFQVPIDKIEVVIQPQSIIHSMVQFCDGAVKAQLGVPSMLIPIEYALYAPDRRALPAEEKLDFKKLTGISFSVPDLEVFRGLYLGIEAGKRGGTMPTVFNAANEEAVAAFLAGKIRYPAIPESIEAAMKAHTVTENPDVEEILSAERDARAFVRDYCAL
ncbi:MAG: 1-deoxy-D-xylulose-5-phosphate reductoisomerase [Eubacteriales bacterium]|nr:1-deoxy-D-xylulose-5-phosphate reductoisomerase [Eubacteriales bacterium]